MKVRITRIADPGDDQKERVVIRAFEELDIGKFLLAVAAADNDGVYPGVLNNCYWFPDRTLGANDLVVVYTKQGKSKIKDGKSGTKTHFFYLGRSRAIFSVATVAPVIMSIDDFEAFDHQLEVPEDSEESG